MRKSFKRAKKLNKTTRKPTLRNRAATNRRRNVHFGQKSSGSSLDSNLEAQIELFQSQVEGPFSFLEENSFSLSYKKMFMEYHSHGASFSGYYSANDGPSYLILLETNN